MNHLSQTSVDMHFSLSLVLMVIHISCAFNGMSYFVKRGGGAGSSASAGTQVSPVYQRMKC